MFDYTVTSPDIISSIDYDRVFISFAEQKTKMSAFHKLAQMGVEFDKIQFRTPKFLVRSHFVRSDDPDPIRFAVARNFQYANIPGNIAECGVFRGTFAKRLNRLFYDKKLYLFDTFEGFSVDSIIKEYEKTRDEHFKTWVSDRFDGDSDITFSDTSLEFVVSQMPFPQNVTIRQGFVPDTFKDVDDTFAFVSLDMDIYEPMFEALKFFWGKMSKGGLLLLHDYIGTDLIGVEMSVEDFEIWLGYKVPKFVCADNISLAIIKI
jgi:hypothetical protein